MDWPISLLAAFSTTALIALWFYVARRELRVKQSMLESAQIQFAASREQAALAGDDPDTQGILERSLDIYRQSAERYNQTLRKPWNFIPGILLGFRKAAVDAAPPAPEGGGPIT